MEILSSCLNRVASLATRHGQCELVASDARNPVDELDVFGSRLS